jgi:GDP/UDP-N,N'-diacetylbacillosamine 2-epimerase (hydrolysing)
MRNKICFTITSRADFSLALPIIKRFKKSKKFKIYLISSGYLSGKKYENKISLIKKKIKIDKEIKNYPLKDNPLEITKSLARGISDFGNYFNKIKPKYIFVFADKYEMLAPVIAATQFDIIICHVEGGDVTHGALDDNIRHAITKLSHFHFCSNSIYKKRLIQLGEDKNRICVSGCPSLELIKKKKINKKIFYKKYNIKLDNNFILSTFHPVTQEITNTKKYIKNLIRALSEFNIQVIFTSPNADNSRETIVKEIKKNQKKNINIKYLNKVDYEDYFKLMNNCIFMIGNSSSGIIESASFSKIAINIGTRQSGRVYSSNIINCNYSTKEIVKAINTTLLRKNHNKKYKNLYLNGKASEKIYKFISKQDMTPHIIKKFVDI